MLHEITITVNSNYCEWTLAESAYFLENIPYNTSSVNVVKKITHCIQTIMTILLFAMYTFNHIVTSIAIASASHAHSTSSFLKMYVSVPCHIWIHDNE